MSVAAPVNYRVQDHSPAAIASAVDYAIGTADGFTKQWRSLEDRSDGRSDGPRTSSLPLAGLRVLELGPGSSLGSAVLLACAGARVVTADRFEAEWDPRFHGRFYAEMLRRVEATQRPGAHVIRRLLAAGRFVADVVDCRPTPAEALGRLESNFDVVVSNAVLEHVEDLQATAASLAGVTVPGGYGLHQVDLRDHRSFDRPLEFLTLSRREYDEIRERSFCEHGCQWRLSAFVAAFEAAGFEVQARPNMFADPAYLADVRPRLAVDFAGLSDEDLSVTSVLLICRRPA